jgi:uncharacterized protein (DUF2235 family)
MSPYMPKNIGLCCDRTANEFAKNRTNVIKLYSALVHDSPAHTQTALELEEGRVGTPHEPFPPPHRSAGVLGP